MSEITSESQLHNPPRQIGVPNIPIPQTNLGFLEHTGIPIEPIENVTDVPPSYDWMVTQWKYHDTFKLNINDAVGTMKYQTRIVSTNTDKDLYSKTPNWFQVPFGYSVWWTGAVSYRFTIVKPPRVTGKLLVRYCQDAFGSYKSYDDDAKKGIARDILHRSILKEWDLSQSNQFEFDVTGSVPIRARPTKIPYSVPHGGAAGEKPPTPQYNSKTFNNTPWIEFEMGRIVVSVAQNLVPGGIFPDTFTIIVEKSFKNANFYTVTDAASQYNLVINNQDDLNS